MTRDDRRKFLNVTAALLAAGALSGRWRRPTTIR
jgi:hypothetical protein